jgi:hypothetical protein
MGKSMSSSMTAASSSSTTVCDQIRNNIEKRMQQLEAWQGQLDFLLSDTTSDRNEIGILLNAIESINRDLTKLKAEQRDNNCLPESTGLTQDNQTVIGGASVRRKTSEALKTSKP